MSEQKIPIPAMLYNAAVGGHVTNSQQIIDENLNREQNDINQETVGAVPYNSTTPNGMGRIVLKKTDNFKEVVEAQTNGNTIFVIKYDFTLTGNVTVPANCVLQFDGGSIDGNNYKLLGSFFINDAFYQIFKNVVFEQYNSNIKTDYIRPEWFGAVGDYNILTKIGTDDSAAFNACISAAEILSIKIVQLSNSNYYIVSGINMSFGNIWLRGSGALLREGVKGEGLQNMNSSIYCPPNTTILTIGDNSNGPLRITDICFGCNDMNNVSISDNTIAIKNICELVQIWPFIVEYCHFEYFNKAISFDSIQGYCTDGVLINRNAFRFNNTAVSFDYRNGQQNSTWCFEFCNNFCNGNVVTLDVEVDCGVCRIENNNLESDLITNLDGSTTSELYANRVRLASEATLIFKYNHFENSRKKILSVALPSRTGSIDIDGNRANGSQAQYKIIDITKPDIGVTRTAILDIINCEFPILFKDWINCVVINNNCPPITFPSSYGKSQIVSKNPFTNSDNVTPYYKHDFYAKNASNFDLRFFNEIIGKKWTAGRTTEKAEGFINNQDKDLIIVYGIYIPKGLRASIYIAGINNSSYGGCNFDKNFNIFNDYEYLYKVERAPSDAASSEFWWFILDSNYYINSLKAQIFKLDEEETFGTEVLFNPIDRLNKVGNVTSSLSVDNNSVGNQLTDITNSKICIWNGTAWVDATGATV